MPFSRADPLPGAYIGTWHTRIPRAFMPPVSGGVARAVVDHEPNSSSLEMWLALADYDGFGESRDFNPAELKITSVGPTIPFTAKIAVGEALVMMVTAQLQDNALTLHYKVVDLGDPDVQHGQGTIELHRTPPAQ